MHRFRLFKDGDMWCALTGSNIQEGRVGFGKTPSEAVKNWEKDKPLP